MTRTEGDTVTTPTTTSFGQDLRRLIDERKNGAQEVIDTLEVLGQKISDYADAEDALMAALSGLREPVHQKRAMQNQARQQPLQAPPPINNFAWPPADQDQFVPPQYLRQQ